MNVRLASRPEGNNEIKHYYYLRSNYYIDSSRYMDIINHAIYWYSTENEMLYCSEKALIEFFMYILWLVNDDSISLDIQVLEYENKDGNELIDTFILAHFPTPEGPKVVKRRDLQDGEQIFTELDVEPYEPGRYMINSWE